MSSISEAGSITGNSGEITDAAIELVNASKNDKGEVEEPTTEETTKLKERENKITEDTTGQTQLTIKGVVREARPKLKSNDGEVKNSTKEETTKLQERENKITEDTTGQTQLTNKGAEREARPKLNSNDGEVENSTTEETTILQERENMITEDTTGQTQLTNKGAEREARPKLNSNDGEVENSTTEEITKLQERENKTGQTQLTNKSAESEARPKLKTLADLITICRREGLQVFNDKLNIPESERARLSAIEKEKIEREQRELAISRETCRTQQQGEMSARRRYRSRNSYYGTDDAFDMDVSNDGKTVIHRRNRLGTGSSWTKSSAHSSRSRGRRDPSTAASSTTNFSQLAVPDDKDLDAEEWLQQRMRMRSKRRKESTVTLVDIIQLKQEEIQSSPAKPRLQAIVDDEDPANTNIDNYSDMELRGRENDASASQTHNSSKPDIKMEPDIHNSDNKSCEDQKANTSHVNGADENINDIKSIQVPLRSSTPKTELVEASEADEQNMSLSNNVTENIVDREKVTLTDGTNDTEKNTEEIQEFKIKEGNTTLVLYKLKKLTVKDDDNDNKDNGAIKSDRQAQHFDNASPHEGEYFLNENSGTKSISTDDLIPINNEYNENRSINKNVPYNKLNYDAKDNKGSPENGCLAGDMITSNIDKNPLVADTRDFKLTNTSGEEANINESQKKHHVKSEFENTENIVSKTKNGSDSGLGTDSENETDKSKCVQKSSESNDRPSNQRDDEAFISNDVRDQSTGQFDLTVDQKTKEDTNLQTIKYGHKSDNNDNQFPKGSAIEIHQNGTRNNLYQSGHDVHNLGQLNAEIHKSTIKDVQKSTMDIRDEVDTKEINNTQKYYGNTNTTGEIKGFVDASDKRNKTKPKRSLGNGFLVSSDTEEDNTSPKSTPGKSTSGKSASSNSTSGKSMQGVSTPGKSTSGNSTAGKSTSGNSTAGKSTSGMSTSGKSMQGVSTPGKSTSGNSTSGKSTSGMSTPGKSTSGNATPGKSMSGKSTPSKSTSGKSMPGSTRDTGSEKSPRKTNQRNSPSNKGIENQEIAHKKRQQTVSASKSFRNNDSAKPSTSKLDATSQRAETTDRKLSNGSTVSSKKTLSPEARLILLITRLKQSYDEETVTQENYIRELGEVRNNIRQDLENLRLNKDIEPISEERGDTDINNESGDNSEFAKNINATKGDIHEPNDETFDKMITKIAENQSLPVNIDDESPNGNEQSSDNKIKDMDMSNNERSDHLESEENEEISLDKHVDLEEISPKDVDEFVESDPELPIKVTKVPVKRKRALKRIDCSWDPEHPLYETIQSGFKSNSKIPKSRHVELALKQLKNEVFTTGNIPTNSEYIKEAKRLYPDVFPGYDTREGKLYIRPNPKPVKIAQSKPKAGHSETETADKLTNENITKHKSHKSQGHEKQRNSHGIKPSKTQSDKNEKHKTKINKGPQSINEHEPEENANHAKKETFQKKLKPRKKDVNTESDDDKLNIDKDHVKKYQHYVENKGDLPKLDTRNKKDRKRHLGLITSDSDGHVNSIPNPAMVQSFPDITFYSNGGHPNSKRKKDMMSRHKSEQRLYHNSEELEARGDSTRNATGAAHSKNSSLASDSVTSLKSPSKGSVDIPITEAVEIMKSRQRFYTENAYNEEKPRGDRVWKLFQRLQTVRKGRYPLNAASMTDLTTNYDNNDNPSFLLMNYSSHTLSDYKSNSDLTRFLYGSEDYEMCSKGRPLHMAPTRKEKAFGVLVQKIRAKDGFANKVQ